MIPKRKVRGLGFKSFLEAFKKASKPTVESLEEIEKLTKNVTSGIGPIDEALKNVEITVGGTGLTKVGELEIGAANFTLRTGNLKKILEFTGSKAAFSDVESAALKSLVADLPECELDSLDEIIKVNKRQHPHLDVGVDNIDNLSKNAKKDIEKVESKVLASVKAGTYVALTIGGFAVAADWLIKATKARQGCFMMTTVNNKVTSCKISSFTCQGDTSNPCTDDVSKYYSVSLAFMYIASLDDTDAKKMDLATKLAVSVGDLNDKFIDILTSKFATLTSILGTSDAMTGIEICGITNPNIEDGVVPVCRMCDPTASPLGTQYIDPSQYAENITFKCIANPSLIDTITDAAKATGLNLLDDLSTLFGPFVKILVAFVFVVFIIVVLVNVFKMMSRKKV